MQLIFWERFKFQLFLPMRYILYFFLIFGLSSCGLKYKTIPYFTDLPASQPVVVTAIENSNKLTVQKGDEFILEVSSLNDMASAVFSNSSGANTSLSATNSSGSTVGSYVVDREGNIRIPLAGSVKLENLTLIEARSIIEETLKTYLKEPVVNLKLVNFRISILGDVMKPGSYNVDRENINLLEAVSLAGDLNITAKRNDILLVREKDGKREYIRMDLQSKAIFESPYFYLKSGDILYIQPSETKYASVDSRYRDIGLILSALSILVLGFAQLNR